MKKEKKLENWRIAIRKFLSKQKIKRRRQCFVSLSQQTFYCACNNNGENILHSKARELSREDEVQCKTLIFVA